MEYQAGKQPVKFFFLCYRYQNYDDPTWKIKYQKLPDAFNDLLKICWKSRYLKIIYNEYFWMKYDLMIIPATNNPIFI